MELEQQQQQQQQQPPQNTYGCEKYYDIINLSYFGLFGVMFSIYQSDPKYYNGCESDQFLSWCASTRNLCMVFAGVSAIKLFLLKYNLTSKFEPLWMIIEASATVLTVFCVIKLSILDEKQCGSLHSLVKTFYIITYILLGLILLIVCFCVFVCLGITPSKRNRSRNSPEQEQLHINVNNQNQSTQQLVDTSGNNLS